LASGKFESIALSFTAICAEFVTPKILSSATWTLARRLRERNHPSQVNLRTQPIIAGTIAKTVVCNDPFAAKFGALALNSRQVIE
jgi:hypothetical protein